VGAGATGVIAVLALLEGIDVGICANCVYYDWGDDIYARPMNQKEFRRCLALDGEFYTKADGSCERYKPDIPGGLKKWDKVIAYDPLMFRRFKAYFLKYTEDGALVVTDKGMWASEPIEVFKVELP